MIPPRRLLFNIAATVSAFIFVGLLIGWLNWENQSWIATIWKTRERKYILSQHHGYVELVPLRYESASVMVYEPAQLRIPSYLVVPLFLIPPFLWMKQKRKRWIWYSSGHCPTCGYDLRVTAGRCPECGNVPRDPR